MSHGSTLAPPHRSLSYSWRIWLANSISIFGRCSTILGRPDHHLKRDRPVLMERYLESWYLWIVADTIYVPLYASRGLYLTSILYAIFWFMAIHGLQNFQRIYSEQKLKQQQSL